MKTKTYSDVLKGLYSKVVYGEKLDLKDIHLALAELDNVAPQKNISSKLKVWFDCNDGKFLGIGSGSRWGARLEQKWIPNPGVDPETSRYQQTKSNGTFLDNVCRQNFEFNDVLVYRSATPGGRGAGKLFFESTKFKHEFAITCTEFADIGSRMMGGYIIGRFCFTGSPSYSSLRPLDNPE